MKTKTAMAVLFGLVFSLTACQPEARRDPPKPSAPVPQAPAPEASPTAPTPARETEAPKSISKPTASPSSPAGLEGLLSESGILRKVVVRVPDAPFFDRPGGKPIGRTAPFFSVWVVFEESRGWRLVGSNGFARSKIGWLAPGSVFSWDTRIGARTLRDDGRGRRPSLPVWESLADVQAMLRGKQGKPPVAFVRPRTTDVRTPWPIASVHHEIVDGTAHEVVELLFVGEFAENEKAKGRANAGEPTVSKSAAPATKEVLEQAVGSLRRLEVMFCVDNTNSTEPFRDAIVRTIDQVTQKLTSSNVELAVGLTLYRDYVKGLVFDENDPSSVTRQEPLDTKARMFRRTVSRLRIPRVPSVDWPEAVYDGLITAIQKTSWHPSNLSQRVVILLGDNSAHEPGERGNPRGLSLDDVVQAANAPDKHVTIHALCIEGGGGDEEQARHARQWRALAKGTGGAFFRIEKRIAQQSKVAPVVDAIVSAVRELLASETTVVAERVAVVRAAAEGKLEEAVASREIDARAVTEVATFLRDFGGIELAKLGAGRPAVARGFTVTKLNGVPVLEKMAYVARSELSFLLSDLNGICAYLGADIHRQTWDAAYGSHIGEFFRARRPETITQRWQALGIPHSSHSILARRADEFGDERARQALRRRLEQEIVPALTRARNDNDTFTLVGEIAWGWIPERILP